MMTKVRMYLDVDGCINAFRFTDLESSLWGETSTGIGHVEPESDNPRQYNIIWHQEMVESLRALDIDLVWLTTWRSDAPKSIGKLIGWGEDARVLHPLDGITRFPSIYWKYAALIQDQKDDPAPFIWVDDELDNFERWVDEEFEALESQSLIVAPNSILGISPRNVEDMREFIKQVS